MAVQTTARPMAAIRRNKSRRGRRTTILVNTVAVILAVVFGFPIYWALNTSFKSAIEYQTFTPHFWPHHLVFTNYTTAFHVLNFADDLKNSLIMTVVAVTASVIAGFFGAIAIARFRFAGRKAIIFTIMIVQMLPMAVMIIPMYVALSKVNGTDALWGVIVVYVGLTLPYMVWTLRGFVVNVPRELDEAAMVNGCSRWQMIFRIILPLVGPGLVATSLYGFIQIWNDWVIIVTLNVDNDKQNLMAWLAGQSTLRGTAWGPLMASAIITALPVVAVFLAIQRHIATGLTAGAVKG